MLCVLFWNPLINLMFYSYLNKSSCICMWIIWKNNFTFLFISWFQNVLGFYDLWNKVLKNEWSHNNLVYMKYNHKIMLDPQWNNVNQQTNVLVNHISLNNTCKCDSSKASISYTTSNAKRHFQKPGQMLWMTFHSFHQALPLECFSFH